MFLSLRVTEHIHNLSSRWVFSMRIRAASHQSTSWAVVHAVLLVALLASGEPTHRSKDGTNVLSCSAHLPSSWDGISSESLGSIQCECSERCCPYIPNEFQCSKWVDLSSLEHEDVYSSEPDTVHGGFCSWNTLEECEQYVDGDYAAALPFTTVLDLCGRCGSDIAEEVEGECPNEGFYDQLDIEEEESTDASSADAAPEEASDSQPTPLDVGLQSISKFKEQMLKKHEERRSGSSSSPANTNGQSPSPDVSGNGKDSGGDERHGGNGDNSREKQTHSESESSPDSPCRADEREPSEVPNDSTGSGDRGSPECAAANGNAGDQPCPTNDVSHGEVPTSSSVQCDETGSGCPAVEEVLEEVPASLANVPAEDSAKTEVAPDIEAHNSPQETAHATATAEAVPTASATATVATENVATATKEDDDAYLSLFNYASMDAGAKVVSVSENTQGRSNILNEDKDAYLLSPCSVEKKFVVIELSEEILMTSLDIGTYEFFSSLLKQFRVEGARKFPCRSPSCEWSVLGEYVAADKRGVFHYKMLHPAYVRYVRISTLSQHGSEFYCPISVVRVYGSSLLEDLQDDIEDGLRELDEFQVTVNDAEHVVRGPQVAPELSPTTTEAPSTPVSATLSITPSAVPSVSAVAHVSRTPSDAQSNADVSNGATGEPDEKTGARTASHSPKRSASSVSKSQASTTSTTQVHATDTAAPSPVADQLHPTGESSEPMGGLSGGETGDVPTTADSGSADSETISPSPSGADIVDTDSATPPAEPDVNAVHSASATPTPSVSVSVMSSGTPTEVENGGTGNGVRVNDAAVPSTRESVFKTLNSRIKKLEFDNTLLHKYLESMSTNYTVAMNAVMKKSDALHAEYEPLIGLSSRVNETMSELLSQLSTVNVEMFLMNVTITTLQDERDNLAATADGLRSDVAAVRAELHAAVDQLHSMVQRGLLLCGGLIFLLLVVYALNCNRSQ